MVNINFNKEYLVKSPLNYTGGKFKLLPQILPLFPSKISMFYDVFGGGGNVAINSGAEYIYYNDIIHYIGSLLDGIKQHGSQLSYDKIIKIINEYDLSTTNLEGFNKLREDYNNGINSWDYFYTLICYSFNNQIRFNNNHQYNSSFGKNRSSFNMALQDKFLKFAKRLEEIDISFDNKDFREIDYSDADENDLVYFDPPYTISCGVYQDGKRGFSGWCKRDEEDLLSLCDRLNEQESNFAISNVFESKGLRNQELIEWSKKYNVHYLNTDYTNASHQRGNRDKKDVEILITNY